ncbi:MOSC domain-containing protein [Rhizobium sp. YIM 134829]|uniref:MOSC domain-containing protein n=1 Tax=Rhizobium sp. YIM 134829 TaxID=3390453 RepID=UPI00397B7D90
MRAIAAVCIGQPIQLGGRKSRTGIDKRPADGPVFLGELGLEGDAVCNRTYHGGPDQAVYGLGSADLKAWSAELGHDVPPGLLGENLVIANIDSRTIAVGDRFETDRVTLEVTATRMPCSTLALRMGDPHFTRRFTALGQPGFYCRVLRAGLIEAGDPVRVTPYEGERLLMGELLTSKVKALKPETVGRWRSTPLAARVAAELDRVHGPG